MSGKKKGAVVAAFVVAVIGLSGAIVPCILALHRNGSLATFPLSVLVGSAVFLGMLMGFLVHRWSQ